LKTSDVVAARAMAQSYFPISANVKLEESGGSCQMTIVTLVTGCGNTNPGHGTRHC
jgi:hypothetical protein